MTQPTRGSMKRVSGEVIAHLFKLPDDAIVLKIVPSNVPMYTFDILYMSASEGLEVAEASSFPIMTRSEFDGT